MNIIKSCMLTDSMQPFPFSLIYHYSAINLQKKTSVSQKCYQNTYVPNLMASKNKPLYSIFQKQDFFNRYIYIIQQD